LNGVHLATIISVAPMRPRTSVPLVTGLMLFAITSLPLDATVTRPLTPPFVVAFETIAL
jgi:hypothetical protein